MWNNTNLPLAYLITFRCYGTWLHGDTRGSVDRFHNQYQAPYIPHNERWRQHNAQALKREPVLLNAVTRICRGGCSRNLYIAQLALRAINVRTNHVHVVVPWGRRLSALMP
jgi:hypothetical protein